MDDTQETALAGIRTRLMRANSHLESLDLEQSIFNDRHPYTTDNPKRNADYSQWVYPVKFRQPIPLMWGVVLGEIIHDLRSALDHTVFQLTLAYSGREFEGTGFPISEKPTNWDVRSKKRTSDNPLGFARTCSMYQLRGVGCGVVEYVKRLQPDPSQIPQTSVLLALQLLWNQDKHRLIHSWGIEVQEGGDFRFEGTDRTPIFKLADGVLQEGDVALTVTFDSPVPNGQLVGHLPMVLAFENPADPGPGPADRLWRLHDATCGVVGTLLAAIAHQDEGIL
jgi:hypothetical protein